MTHADYMRQWTAENHEKWRAISNAAQRRWRAKHPEKRKAHTAVYRAIKKGLLVRAEACGRCQKKCRTEASHDDYSKPLEVEWLCRQCHAKKDTRRD